MSGKTGIGVGILAGIVIGVGIGVLVAPEKGSQTRKKIKDGYGDAKNELKNKFESATSNLKDKAAKIDLQGSYDDLVATVSSKADDVIAFLENKLDSLKSEAAKQKRNV